MRAAVACNKSACVLRSAPLQSAAACLLGLPCRTSGRWLSRRLWANTASSERFLQRCILLKLGQDQPVAKVQAGSADPHGLALDTSLRRC